MVLFPENMALGIMNRPVFGLERGRGYMGICNLDMKMEYLSSMQYKISGMSSGVNVKLFIRE